LPEAVRLRPAFPTPALGPKRCVASPRLGFLILRIAGRRGVISDFISELY
jgi:hypothetical protein